MKARIRLKQGYLAESLEWAQEIDRALGEEVLYIHEFENLTLARIYIAAGSFDRRSNYLEKAKRKLEKLQTSAEANGRSSSLISIWLLQALVWQALDDLPAAFEKLERALSLAEPEGYLNTFRDEGPALKPLIETVWRQSDRAANSYLRKILEAFQALPKMVGQPGGEMVEPLSERELEVLKLLRSDSSGPEMARQLVISLNTLRTHTKNIFSKLGVNNRRAALRRARELGLI